MVETSTAPSSGISGIAYAMRYSIASDIGMSFELAIKSVAQGLSPQPDGQPQVLNRGIISNVTHAPWNGRGTLPFSFACGKIHPLRERGAQSHLSFGWWRSRSA